MRPLLLALLIFAATVPAHASRQFPSLTGVSPRLEAEVVAIMEKIRVLDADIKAESPRDIVDYLRQVARKQSGSLNIFLVVDEHTPETISVTFANDTFRSALDKICTQSQLYWWVSRQALVIGPRSYYEKQIAEPSSTKPTSLK